ncbi:uncharacterized protein L3040_000007 [Drepanopeziza brunnea f. sp. 'multigermtubi']|uniref:Fasciclin domain family protein n=1 Tax=Marssonina brunnea f. sp. multigermtubi (strain MB_m1) TaxID=1072389 RepID=K1XPM9_MARBU|nr:Fasciclin domain family protein [Drepanopeziza brunnea f. sp. 'multigermtubi' MB_m1]EKD14479.1 Fasciclin domain family protein [Drepanopeziza brunnea f. sp. 'multigermtubi' MB_m1]KAJ5053716.1 hypothetical protein L3040_000007 [Drepanopeziza brunnea f. sp. 'multigermtubi']
MRFTTTFLPLAALAFSTTAFVIPDEQLTTQIIESQNAPQTFFDRIAGNVEDVWSGVEESFKDTVAFGQNAIDNAIDAASDTAERAKNTFECYASMTKFDAQSWLDSAVSEAEDIDVFDHHHREPPPHHGPPEHHKPHPGHDKPNKTVYELIASSKYTTKLASLINEYPDLVETLNGTAANYTVFAPTDKAFEKIPKHHKPSKEVIKKILAYHVSPDFYPAGRVLVTHTIPTALGEERLGSNPQRLRVGFALTKGLNINFYSRIIAIDIFGTNGVIHGVDSLLLPPPPALKIVELLPGEFSTLNLALEKTGLFEKIAAAPHEGGTLFAPSNWAFQKLGPRINAFLFSKYGQKYLKGLLEYHIVANQTLYSDAFYKEKSGEDTEDVPKGRFHIDLPTLLENKSLSIDVARWGGLISIKINGFSSVSVQDGIAKDGVIHVVSSVLVPPKTPGAASTAEELEDDVEELKTRLERFVQDL